ncbi:putative dipeptidyl-aminopeptidase B [Tothia fuscella]|uniref:dipeptidyl-peptidase IV n=1 Tax=Tothia fuscella TaxID=1048955 RepID=A0A9P4U412_9PEZI|nr:putative dipeptidyl-aminopeptidase B [Tothia fuscella]
MAPDGHDIFGEETQPLAQNMEPIRDSVDDHRESFSSISTTSAILEQLNDKATKDSVHKPYSDEHSDSTLRDRREEFDLEDGKYYPPTSVDRKAKRYLWIMGMVCLVGWLLAAGLFVARGSYKHASSKPHDPAATSSRGSGHKITLDQILGGQWRAQRHAISWIAGPQGEDGLLLERGDARNKDYLVVKDVRSRDSNEHSEHTRILMSQGSFRVGEQFIYPSETWPSPDLQKVLVLSDKQSNWRHSFTGRYWIFDVNSQTAQALDPSNIDGRVQLASWSPQSDAIVFTRDNNMFLRDIKSGSVKPITKDGGPELFYGVPDWVFEEEVFAGNSATWWSEDGKYIAFLRTDESKVPTFPIQYYLSRPSGEKPKPGEENYPEVRDIKYPKAGAPNPIVNLQFYDVEKAEVFYMEIEGDFEDKDRLITEVVWAGKNGKVLVRETNRESDVLKVILVDVERRTGQTVREVDVNALDGGWFEVSEDTTYIPADPGNGRPHAGYVDTVIHDGFDHLAYFTPLDSKTPILLTSGKWEVVKAPSAIDLKNNYVYFIATKESSIQRHAYRVKLDGTGMEAVTDTSKEGYYDVSFSKAGGYGLVSYSGPDIPWQKIINMPGIGEKYEETIEDNSSLKRFAAEHEMPIQIYQTVNIDGFELNLVERRPPHFDPKKKYPVLFWMYQGPGSQSVSKQFTVDFQAYVASGLGYIVVTLDGRGTGFVGRKTRCAIRGNIGHWESYDQIAAAKMWAKKKYVDANRMAIWGWSYGGFMTLKTLEVDAGETFKYGMAVAPVTDWRFYDSIYTERYMHTPQNNPGGYDNTSIHDVESLSKNVRFLVMHGVADDNVHTQSTYTLIDKLDLGGVTNYDVHVFPDSDHSIYFHNANKIVYEKLTNWLINAFNGEWLRTVSPVPIVNVDKRKKKSKRMIDAR